MKRVIFALFFVCLSSGLLIAQNSDDYKKLEFSAGYSNGQASGTLNGFEVSGVYNVTRYIGVKGDFSAAFSSRRYDASSTSPAYTASYKNTRGLYNVLGGIQVKDNANSGKFKPFAHALFGVGIARSTTSDFQCTPTASCPTFAAGTGHTKGFAAAVGGGLDLRLNEKIQLRLIQVDYNPVRSPFGTDHNARIGAGIVF